MVSLAFRPDRAPSLRTFLPPQEPATAMSNDPRFQHLSPAWTHLTSFTAVKGEGAWLTDSDGNRHLDFTCGIGVTNTGHCHPHVVKAIQEQAGKLIFGQMNCTISQASLDLAETLLPKMPEGLDSFFFSNSGAEAVEAAVKLTKMATGKPNIIALQGGFHGRTHMTMALTASKTAYRAKYQPLPSGVFFSPFPLVYQWKMPEEQAIQMAIHQLEYILKSTTSPEETGAVLLEPVLGEGGYVPAPPKFIAELRRVCDKHGLLLIVDEIQSGTGRTGKWWAHERSGITPDIMIMAKGIASGMPFSAIATRRDLMQKWAPGSHGGTYGGGNAVVMAAAKATIEAIDADNMVENAAERGEELMAGLRGLQEEYPAIGDVRGWGLMVATEFSKDGMPDGQTAGAVCCKCLEKNLMLLTCGTWGNIIRWIPPLMVSSGDVQHALGTFKEALTDILG
jgi:4-aminobutyrate aminotransferase